MQLMYRGRRLHYNARLEIYENPWGEKFTREFIEDQVSTLVLTEPIKEVKPYSYTNCCNCGASRQKSQCSYCLSVT